MPSGWSVITHLTEYRARQAVLYNNTASSNPYLFSLILIFMFYVCERAPIHTNDTSIYCQEQTEGKISVEGHELKGSKHNGSLNILVKNPSCCTAVGTLIC